ncbi:YqzM family protein [Bacillus sp. B15-48]|nr:YqzM family protein [Bacillus sp. B15-48]MBM4762357.1 YqzM family protein [Bacillus sp. B15-48]
MNQFEKNINNKRHDIVDAGVGFIVSFVFFATMFIIATVIQVIGS